jgi:hypothetical protein
VKQLIYEHVYRATGEFRVPVKGEFFMYHADCMAKANSDHDATSCEYHIFTREIRPVEIDVPEGQQ